MDALPLTPGAVLVPIIANAPHGVLFVERATHLRRHAGQIGLPGGRADPLDGGDPERTALREFFEELGIESDRVTVVGRLPALEQSLNRFVITPIVGVVDPGVTVRPDGNEIAGFFDVPLSRNRCRRRALWRRPRLCRAPHLGFYGADFEVVR